MNKRPLRALLGTTLIVVAAFSTAPARAAEPVVGLLVAIGGGTEEADLITEILELAKGTASRVAIVNAASSEPERSGPAYVRFFHALGVKQADLVPLLKRDEAYAPAALDLLTRSDLIYFTGGNQIRLARTLAGTPAHGAILAAYQRGAVIAGTSAGAMVWGPRYLAAGSSAGALQQGRSDLDMRQGLGLVPNLLVDTHFAREGRLGRLLVATAQSSGLLGIGIDERTAAVIGPDGIRALGAGRVTVLDTSEAKAPPKPAATFSLHNVSMHMLGDGEALRFSRDASEKRPMLPPRSRAAASLPGLWWQGTTTPEPSIALLASRSGRMPEEVLILAGDDAGAAAATWKATLSGHGALNVRVLGASQLVGDTLTRYLATPSGLLLVDDERRTLAKALAGEQGTAVRAAAARMPVAVAGTAVAIPGETSGAPGAQGGELVAGMRLAPGVVATRNIWAPEAFDRLVLDCLLAGGALGLGLSPDNGVRLENGRLKAEGKSPVLLLETDHVSMANPTVPSARDLVLNVLAPGEEITF